MKQINTTHKFYHVLSIEGKDWATEIQPISERRAKKCESCGATGGQFFRDCGSEWLVGDPLTVKHNSSPTTQCWSCWMANDQPAFYIDKKGQTVRPWLRTTVMFAKDRTELVWLVKRWKNGQRLMREVRRRCLCERG